MTSSILPGDKNNYFVDFTCADNDKVSLWNNRSIKTYPWAPCFQKIVPFDFCFNICFKNNSCDSNNFIDNEDVFVVISSKLKPEDIANFSGVNIACYLACKNERIWKTQLCNLFPDVILFNDKLITFSSNIEFSFVLNCEKQCKIVAHRINQLKKPYVLHMKFKCKEISDLAKDKSLVILKRLKSISFNISNCNVSKAMSLFNSSISGEMRECIIKIHKEIVQRGNPVSGEIQGCGESFFLNQDQFNSAKFSIIEAIEIFSRDYKHVVFDHCVSEIKNDVIYYGPIIQQIEYCKKALELIPQEFNNQEKFDATVNSTLSPSEKCVIL